VAGESGGVEEALRLGRRYQMIEDIDPDWTEPKPWRRSGTEGC